MKKRSQFAVAFRSTGDIIQYFDSLYEAEEEIKFQEQEDLDTNNFTPNFYQVLEWDEENERYDKVK